MTTTPRGTAAPGAAAVNSTQAPSGLHAQVLEHLGMAICGGKLAAGDILRSEEFEEKLAVSRSVIREVLRVLSALGMVASRRRVGVEILPAREWNLFDPLVIRWRLATNDRLGQLRSLAELRTAVEPQAARLAAVRAEPDQVSELLLLSGRMWAAGQSGDAAEFLRLDVQFHQLLLTASGNEMFAQLHRLVAEVLVGRAQYGLMPDLPHHEALQLHMDIAVAVQAADGSAAQAAMERIVERSMEETSEFWARHGTGSR
ncbi:MULTISPECIES: FadR/GntR family transcriptional regulator [Arthrobacter]|uniref:FCD domain-containing protein n=1 Tax=Arthrobacter jinronghuae TaxID=2964609 RepID=A0ABT1NUX4_9MICC|nr:MULTISPECIES: FCD domain-containing protein [Arthrobacter]MCQ1951530.1 FCD domain-containing protein [Arthrobacter jinronghuae]MCQ1954709.1 FCD domain-containing protein [Arthrobacter sp. zg-Y238]MCQ1957913.1 FCD domain-containing protein [Arthrobacter jinronghuae]UWX79608.1 FCD domain-containing protein [Arthrobacter jinronghuae]